MMSPEQYAQLEAVVRRRQRIQANIAAGYLNHVMDEDDLYATGDLLRLLHEIFGPDPSETEPR